jgi:hypothetical protein
MFDIHEIIKNELIQWCGPFELGKLAQVDKECNILVRTPIYVEFLTNWTPKMDVAKACSQGHLYTAKWLYSRFTLAGRARGRLVYRSIKESCKTGMTESLKWLYSLQIGASAKPKIREFLLDKRTFWRLCADGHLSAIKWLMLIRSDKALIESGPSFDKAQKEGGIGFLKWLSLRSSLGYDDYRRAFTHAIYGGHESVINHTINL